MSTILEPPPLGALCGRTSRTTFATVLGPPLVTLKSYYA